MIEVAESSLAYDRTTRLSVHRLALTPLSGYALISSMYSSSSHALPIAVSSRSTSSSSDSLGRSYKHGQLLVAIPERPRSPGGASSANPGSVHREVRQQQQRSHPQKIPVGSASTSWSSLAKLKDAGSA